MRLVIEVEHVDGTYRAVALPPEFIRWEKKTGGKFSDLQKRLGMEDMAFLAWASLKRQNLVTQNLDEWADGLLSLTPVAEEAPRPTPGEASDE